VLDVHRYAEELGELQTAVRSNAAILMLPSETLA
jgi:hypothetical protein